MEIVVKQDETKELLSIIEAREYINITPMGLERMLEVGTIPVVNEWHGKQCTKKIKKSDLDRLLSKVTRYD